MSLPQEMFLRYFLLREQHFYPFYSSNGSFYNDGKQLHTKEEIGKCRDNSTKVRHKIKVLAIQFFALELELDRLLKQYGIKDSRSNEKFLKAIQKAAASKGMTVAEYRDKILFLYGRNVLSSATKSS